jgi:hypothetical protein
MNSDFVLACGGGVVETFENVKYLNFKRELLKY